MRWKGCILVLLLVSGACEEEKVEVAFRVKMDGFVINADPAFPEPEHTEFTHRLSSGLISFSRGKKDYSFYIKDGMIENYPFSLPPGTYILNSEIPDASFYGQAAGSFVVLQDTVTITEHTNSITIRAKSNCSLLLVNDEQEQLDEGPIIMEWHSYGYIKAHPMTMDSITGLYYAYFTPDTAFTDPSAFIWFYGEEPGVKEEGLTTTGFNIGYQYYFNILE